MSVAYWLLFSRRLQDTPQVERKSSLRSLRSFPSQPRARRGSAPKASSHPWHDLEIGDKAPAEVHAVIEIPSKSKVKYELDKESGAQCARRHSTRGCPYSRCAANSVDVDVTRWQRCDGVGATARWP
jgi:hypothetical protein